MCAVGCTTRFMTICVHTKRMHDRVRGCWRLHAVHAGVCACASLSVFFSSTFIPIHIHICLPIHTCMHAGIPLYISSTPCMHARTPHAHAPATTHAVTVDAVGRLRVVLGPGATVGDLQDVLAKMTDIPASRQNIIRGGTGSVAASLSLSLSLSLCLSPCLSLSLSLSSSLSCTRPV